GPGAAARDLRRDDARLALAQRRPRGDARDRPLARVTPARPPLPPQPREPEAPRADELALERVDRGLREQGRRRLPDAGRLGSDAEAGPPRHARARRGRLLALPRRGFRPGARRAADRGASRRPPAAAQPLGRGERLPDEAGLRRGGGAARPGHELPDVLQAPRPGRLAERLVLPVPPPGAHGRSALALLRAGERRGPRAQHAAHGRELRRSYPRPPRAADPLLRRPLPDRQPRPSRLPRLAGTGRPFAQ